MEMLLLLLLASAGATFIVVASTLFQSFRDLFEIDGEIFEAIKLKQRRPTTKQRFLMFFGQLFHCPLCFGFWMTAVMYFFVYGFAPVNIFLLFAYACAGSATSMLLYRIINK